MPARPVAGAYVAKQDAVSINRTLLLKAAASGNAWVLCFRFAIGTSATAGADRVPVQRSVNLNTPASVEQTNTRSVTQQTTAAVAGSTQNGSVLVFTNTGVHSSILAGAWRPPRPWALPYLVNSDEIAFFNSLSQNPSGGWWAAWTEGPPDSSIGSSGRRSRRAGLWHYRNSHLRNSALGNNGAVGRVDESWVAYAPPFRLRTTPRNLCIGAPPSTPRYSAINHQNPALV